MMVEPATAGVADAVARIEVQRQEREKESGVPVSCSWALGRLHELLPRERKSAGTSAESRALRASIEAATQAIGQLRELAQITGRRATQGDRRWRHRKSWRDA
jgi:hypothetical protein